MLIQINDQPEIWVNTELLTGIGFVDDAAYVYVVGNPNGFRSTPEQARALMARMNNQAAAQVITHDQAPTTTITTKLLAMTRDTTKSGGTMWRCSTERGFMVNVFQHDDPLKDSFTLFVTAGYGPDMTTLEPGETLNWLQHPVQVELRASGAFWNVVTVTTRPADALPDAPEADAEA